MTTLGDSTSAESTCLLFARALLSDEPILAAGDNWFTAQGVVKRGENVGTGEAEVLGSAWRWRLVVRHGLGCGSGGTSGCAGHSPTRNSILTPTCPGRGGGAVVTEDCHILRPVKICRPVCSEVFNARTYPHGARLIPTRAMRRARVYQNNKQEGIKILSVVYEQEKKNRS